MGRSRSTAAVPVAGWVLLHGLAGAFRRNRDDEEVFDDRQKARLSGGNAKNAAAKEAARVARLKNSQDREGSSRDRTR